MTTLSSTAINSHYLLCKRPLIEKESLHTGWRPAVLWARLVGMAQEGSRHCQDSGNLASRDFLLQREDYLAWRGGEDVPRLHPLLTLPTFSDFLLSAICPQTEPSYQEKVRELVPAGLFLDSHIVFLQEEVGDLHKSAPELL